MTEPSNDGLIRAGLIMLESLAYVKHFSGMWYRWGAQGVDAFDCSGLAVEYLRSMGILRRTTDINAQELKLMFEQNGALRTTERFEKNNMLMDPPQTGDLVFFKAGIADSRIVHVEIMLSAWQSIGAAGGGEHTKTFADAVRDEAFVKIRPAILERMKTYACSGKVKHLLAKAVDSLAPIR